MKPVNNVLGKMLLIVLLLVIRPVGFIRLTWHVHRTRHHYQVDCFNFRYDVWCKDCGKVFSDEIL